LKLNEFYLARNPPIVTDRLSYDRMLDELMHSGVGDLIVTDENGTYRGLLRCTTLMRQASEEHWELLLDKDAPAFKLGDDLKSVLRKIIEHHMSSAAVVDENNKVIGGLTDWELLAKVILRLTTRVTVEDLAEVEPFSTIWWGTPLYLAKRIMDIDKSTCAILIDEHGKLAGTLDYPAILRGSERVTVEKTSSLIGPSGDVGGWDPDSIFYITKKVLTPSNKPCKEFMYPLLTCYQESSVQECAKNMLTKRVPAIVVIDYNENPVGVLRKRTLLRAALS